MPKPRKTEKDTIKKIYKTGKEHGELHIHFAPHQMFHGDFGAGITPIFQPRVSVTVCSSWGGRCGVEASPASPRVIPSGIRPLCCLPEGMDSAGPVLHPWGWGSSKGGEVRGCACGAVLRLGKRFPTLCPELSASGVLESHPRTVRTQGTAWGADSGKKPHL